MLNPFSLHLCFLCPERRQQRNGFGAQFCIQNINSTRILASKYLALEKYVVVCVIKIESLFVEGVEWRDHITYVRLVKCDYMKEKKNHSLCSVVSAKLFNTHILC